MTFTKEQLIERCEEAIASLKPCAGVAEAKGRACFEIALSALAVMEADPVYWQFKSVNGDWLGVGKNGAEQATREGCEVRPLYTSPQPLTTSERAELENYRNAQQVLLKDHQIRELVNELRDIAVEYHGTQQLRERIARAIRAAMLQGKAEPVTTACKLPEGWVMVPREATSEMINSAMRDNETGEVAEIYELMIAAAPKQEA